MPAVNGVVNSVLRICDHLVERGHTPVVVAPSGNSFHTRSGARVDVVRVPGMAVPTYAGLTMARPGVDLHGVLSDIHPDVVHLASPLVLGRAGAVAARDLELPCVAVFQTDMSGFLQRYHCRVGAQALWSALRRLHNMTDLTLVPSTASAYELRARGIGPLAVWGRGVDGERFHPRHRSERLHRELADGDNLLVGFVGRLAAEKRVEMLEPITRLPGVNVVVVGDGPKRRSLERRLPNAEFLGLQTGGYLGRTMATLDLLVNPGADETFCQVVQEALACGVPVIAAAAGGPLDLVRHRDNGWLWAGDDPQVLAAQVASLRDDRAQLAQAARRSRASVASRTWTVIGDELIAHYRSVLKTSRSSRPPHAPGEVVSILRPRSAKVRRRAS